MNRAALQLNRLDKFCGLRRIRQISREQFGLAAVRAEGDALAERIRRECTALPDPDPETMFEHVYRDPHPLVAEERSWFAAYRASFLDDEVGG